MYIYIYIYGIWELTLKDFPISLGRDARWPAKYDGRWQDPEKGPRLARAGASRGSPRQPRGLLGSFGRAANSVLEMCDSQARRFYETPDSWPKTGWPKEKCVLPARDASKKRPSSSEAPGGHAERGPKLTPQIIGAK